MTQAHTEFEDELEMEYEDEYEDEAFLGPLAKIAGSLLGEEEYEDEYEMEEELEGEFEDEFEMELESEFEDEDEGEEEYELEDEYEGEDEFEDEAFLGGLASIASSLLGEGEDEYEDEAESEEEYFFKNIGRALRKVPWRKVIKFAAPKLATVFGGPAAGMLAKAVTSQLEGEFEDELEGELEEMATAPVSSSQSEAEYLAARATATESEAEAESFIGSAVSLAITPRERQELEQLLPSLLRGASVLTQVLHRNRSTRQGLRLLPGIVGSTAGTLARLQASGRQLTPADVGSVLGASANRVMTDPRWQHAVARRHARGLAHVHRRHHGHRHGHRHPRRYRSYRGYTRGPGYARSSVARRGRPATTIRRRPVAVRTVRPGARIGRPRPGVVRVVTPVRVPARGGRPARTIKVVSDVKVPRGAVPSGRPVPVTAKKRR